MAVAKPIGLRVITVVIASSVELNTLLESTLLMVSSATLCSGKNHFGCVCCFQARSQGRDKSNKHQSSSKSRLKSKNFNEFVQSDSDNEGQQNDYNDKKLQEYNNVETLYYQDVAISSSEQAKCRIMCDLKMNLGTKSCLNKCTVDTGAGGNLLPTGVYKCLSDNVDKLAKTIDRSVRLVACNNMEIKQYGTCYITVQFKTKRLETKFFVMDQTTTLTELIDSIGLSLIMVNCFDSLSSVSNSDESEVGNHDNNDYFTDKTNVKCPNKLASDHFKTVILNEYKELLSGIGTLDGEIKITLKSNMQYHMLHLY